MKRISLNKVMAKLAEQPEKVELAKFDDIKAMASKLDSLQKDAWKLRDDALDKDADSYFANNKMVKAIDELEKLSNRLNKEVDNLGRDIKDMGLNPSQVPALSDALQPLSEAEALIPLAKGEANKRTFTA